MTCREAAEMKQEAESDAWGMKKPGYISVCVCVCLKVCLRHGTAVPALTSSTSAGGMPVVYSLELQWAGDA